MTQVMRHLESKSVKMAEFLTAVYGTPEEDSKRSKTMHENRTVAIFNRLREERFRGGREDFTPGDEYQVTGWEALNAIQGYSQHDGLRRQKTTEFDRILLASRDANVLRAENLLVAA